MRAAVKNFSKSLIPTIGLVMAACVLGGCGGNIPIADANATLIEASGFARSASTDSLIIVTRDSGWEGHLATVTVLVDGKKAANLESSEQVRIYVPAGSHVVAVGPSRLIESPDVALETVTQADGTKRFRVSWGLDAFKLLPQ
jgi:hypothetical protein